MHVVAQLRCSAADSWLSQVVPGILSSTAFTNSGVLFLVWDEGSSDSGCCDEAEGGRIPALVISPLAKNGFQSTTQETHYSLLRTIGDAWGLPRLGMAGQNPPLTEYFSQIRPAADSSLDSSRSPALEPLPSASVPLRGGRYDLGEPGRLFGRAPRDQGRDASTGAHADQSLGDGFSVSLRGR